jgi:hypothetical protein
MDCGVKRFDPAKECEVSTNFSGCPRKRSNPAVSLFHWDGFRRSAFLELTVLLSSCVTYLSASSFSAASFRYFCLLSFLDSCSLTKLFLAVSFAFFFFPIA